MPDQIRVNIPGVGIVDFPSSMTPDEVSAAARKLHLSQGPLAQANAKPLQEPTTYDEGHDASIRKTVGDTGRGILTGMSPIKMVGDFVQAVKNKAALNPKELPPEEQRPLGVQLEDSKNALSDPSTGGEAIGNLLTGLIAPRLPVKPMLRGAGTLLQDYDITKPAKPIGDVLKWAGQESSPAQPLAQNLGPGAKVLHGADQFREPYTIPEPPKPSFSGVGGAPGKRTAPRLVLTPEEINQADQLKKALQPTASLEGMKSAARVMPGDISPSSGPLSLQKLIEQLIQDSQK